MKRFSTLVTAIIGFLWAASAQSAAELATVYKDLAVFETPMALSLKKGIKKTVIDQLQNGQVKETALALWNKSYNPEYRVATYKHG